LSIKIIKPGLLSTIQDTGRKGYQKFGIIESGAMDSFAHRAANILVGNDMDAAAIEITILGPTILFTENSLIAICGGDFTVTINGKRLPQWCPVFVSEGSVLKFSGAKSQIRSYLAIAGGFDLPKEMGSYSTYLRAGIGGYMGRELRVGDVLNVGKTKYSLGSFPTDKSFIVISKYISNRVKPMYAANQVIRVIKGAQFDLFTQESKKLFFSKPYSVLPDSDRMGYRLEGATLALEQKQEMISAAVAFGTIQIPANGQPIILMADHQTTGGYPKIAQVISVDLPLLAQLNLGATIQFQEVTLQEAQSLYIKREQDLQQLQYIVKKELKNFIGGI